VAVHEILVGTTGVASAIRESKTSMIASLIQGGGGQGMQSMDKALQKLVEAGTVSPRDALDKALDKEAFAKIPALRAEVGEFR